MGDERLRSEIRDEQERIILAVRSAEDHWEMAKAQDSFADLLERMADELEMSSAHDRGRFQPQHTHSGSRRRPTSSGMSPGLAAQPSRRLAGSGLERGTGRW